MIFSILFLEYVALTFLSHFPVFYSLKILSNLKKQKLFFYIYQTQSAIPLLMLLPASWESFHKILQLSGFSLLAFKMNPLKLVHRIDMTKEKVYERITGTVDYL